MGNVGEVRDRALAFRFRLRWRGIPARVTFKSWGIDGALAMLVSAFLMGDVGMVGIKGSWNEEWCESSGDLWGYFGGKLNADLVAAD